MYLLKLSSVCRNVRATLLLCLLPALAIPGFSQVEHRNTWKPVRTVEATAPAPTRLAERQKEFNERNSPEQIEKLAKEFFTLINRGYRTGDPGLDALYCAAFEKLGKKEFSAALESYRDFHLARLRAKKIQGQDPSKRIFIEYFNEADKLMDNEIFVASFDKPMPKEVQLGGVDSILNYYNAGKHNGHMINVLMKNGEPGRINWVYQPDYITGPTVHLPTDRAFLPKAYNGDMFFTPLLAAYVQKKDPKYLKKWADIVDDFILNHRRDLAEAELDFGVGWGGAGGPNFGHLLFALNSEPGSEKLINVTTFIRLVEGNWLSSLPLQIRGTRVGGPNRIMHMYGFQLVEAYMSFPELVVAPYLLRERRRCLEWYATNCVNPDGTGIDYAPNYNKNYLTWPFTDIKLYETLKPRPEWLTPEWKAELLENQQSMARYLMRYFSPSGTMPGFKNADRDMRGELYGPNGLLNRLFPGLMQEPESKKLAAILTPPTPKAPAPKTASVEAAPSFNSESYPYGGYYFLRENWKPDAQFAYFNSYRPGASGNWRHNQNIAMEAFGQNMLIFYRWESPLMVDGASQIYAAFGSLYPKSYREDPNAVLYGQYGAHAAWQEPIRSRWHTSSLYDFAEGDIQEPYAEIYTDKPAVFIDDVRHSRQILFARSAGMWIVCDRIRGEKPHTYNLRWGLKPDRGVPEGWSSKGKKIEDDGEEKASASVAKDPKGYAKDQIIFDPAEGTIKTQNPNVPNLSIYHSATADMKLVPGAIAQGTDKFGNAYMVGPEIKADGDFMLATLLYPRKEIGTELKDYKAFRQGTVSGFDASTKPGYAMSYRAGLKSTSLQVGTVSGDASALLSCKGTDGQVTGIALDCAKFAVNGKPETAPCADFEYVIAKDGKVGFTPICRPMGMVEILPAADAFIENVEVSFKHNEKDTEIRYTLDGKEPTIESALYKAPFKLSDTTWVKARAFRKGAVKIPQTQDSTLASVTMAALYSKMPLIPGQKIGDRQRKSGLSFEYFEDDWTISDMKLPLLKPVSTGIAKEFMDISALRRNPNSYAFVYDGFIEIPATGVYTIHAPEEFVSSVANCGYDLRVFLDGKEWYPATRRHNFGNWTIPLEKGSHSLHVRYVDQRRGDLQASKEGGKVSWKGTKPIVKISGPGIEPMPIPADWLSSIQR